MDKIKINNCIICSRLKKKNKAIRLIVIKVYSLEAKSVWIHLTFNKFINIKAKIMIRIC